MVSRLLVFTQPALVSLFAQQHGIDVVKDGWSEWQLSEPALEVEVMELAYMFWVNAARVPPPSICAPPPGEASSRFVSLVNNGLPKVAIFWASSGWGGGRRIPLSVLDPLASLRDVEFFSFQQGPFEKQAQASALPLRQFSSSIEPVHRRDLRFGPGLSAHGRCSRR